MGAHLSFLLSLLAERAVGVCMVVDSIHLVRNVCDALMLRQLLLLLLALRLPPLANACRFIMAILTCFLLLLEKSIIINLNRYGGVALVLLLLLPFDGRHR